jgi:4-amino-4-deoxy-L-arabinose transferase-like glycosyltransferase
MNAVSETSPRFLGLSPAQAAILVIAVSTILRFFYCTWLPILPDETYYYQWSRHLDASFISKGPGVAYTIAAGTSIFGGNNFGVRFFAVLLSAGTAWQIFVLARRWYDETTALLAVLFTGIVPLYAIGAVVMTIDPLSAFFWVWAANSFSRAIQHERYRDWLLTGFAVGCGFLAKYLNALELIPFLLFLLLVPERRALLGRSGFWWMLGAAVICTWPVLEWNQAHGWISAHMLKDRGGLNGPFSIHPASFENFLFMQAIVISPLLFVALLGTAAAVIRRLCRRGVATINEGDLLLLLLFLSVFLFYAVLAWHQKGEANWPAISYLTLIILMVSRWRQILMTRSLRFFVSAAFVAALTQTVVMHNPEFLPLKPKSDPMSRVVGWAEVAARLDQLRQEQHADVLIADAYKEASVFSFHLSDQSFIYCVRHTPPANQFDLWPGYPTAAPHRALWVTYENSTDSLRKDFNTITPLDHIVISFRGKSLREYTIYLCENR